RIIKIKKEIEAGKDFGDAAVEYSEDPLAKTNKGNLSYFTAFQMVVPFENAAFTTAVGEISEPVRSSFGYHLIKVNDIRENRGEVHVAHIMKMFPKGATPEIKAKLKTEIDSIYTELQNGADFAALAKAKSDDKRSAANGGEMPWFAAGRMIKEFAEPAFALKNKGDFTPPIETQYGFHIIKKLDSRGIASFEDSKEDIENRIKKDPLRSITSKTVFTSKLKAEYKFDENTNGILKLKGKNIGDKFENTNFELFKIDGKYYNFEEFQNYLQQEKITTGTYTSKFDKWVEYEITNLENSKLEEKYPEFRYLMQEYHDGILLFNISEEKIWNRAVEDSIGLETFYAKNRKKYLWGERFKGSVITCKNSATKEEAEKLFANKIPIDEIEDMLNSKAEMITIDEGAWEKGDKPIVDYFVWNTKKPPNFDSNLTFIRGDKIPPEPKKLNEARGSYISDYQNYLEQKWIKELHKKYKVKVNKKLLKTIESV
ncbi:MAG: peptidyl-prolyl cis-trans isomerase, partial [Draconibacterium sp.]|nr:peptidyl-prolyl cis-trans isomerase [Draconibacterium sp.]